MKTFEQICEELQSSDNNELKIVWEEAKNERIKANRIAVITCLVIDIILIKFIFNFFISKIISGMGLIFILYFVIPILAIDIIIYAVVNSIFSKNQNKYIKIYKEKIITKIMGNFYTGLEYFPEKEMPKYIYDEAEYNSYYNRYNSEDYFEAHLDDESGVQMAEVETKKVETRRDSKGRTHTTTTIIFHGLFAKIVMNKSINSELKVMRNGSMFLQKNQLKMDSSEFEKYFDVEASNPIIGMQLLTADVMQELIDFQNKTNMEYDFVIKNESMYLRFHCGDMFEPKNIKAGALDKESLEKYFYMLNFTYNLSKKLIKTINDTQI